MENDELQQLIECISYEQFGKLFTHKAVFNSRLRTTGGRYMLGDHSIEINPLVLEKHGIDEMVGVIKHELCHYHLHIEGRGYKHQDLDFKELLKNTSSPRYCKVLGKRNRKSVTFTYYKCQSCGLDYTRQRRMNVQKYRCGKCSGSIKEIR